jgi:hypothetical protein
MATQIAKKQYIIQTNNLFVLPNFATLVEHLPIPKLVAIGYTLEEYMLQCLLIRRPEEAHVLSVDAWKKVLNVMMGSSLDVSLAQRLWPLTQYIQFHEALTLKLQERQKIWLKHNTLVQWFNIDRPGFEIVSLHKEVEDNMGHIESKMMGMPISKNDSITFRGPYVSRFRELPIIITTNKDLVDEDYVGTVLCSSLVLPLDDIRKIENIGVSIIPSCMSSWMNWEKQECIVLTDPNIILNQKCQYLMHSQLLPVDDSLLVNLTRLSIGTLFIESNLTACVGMSYGTIREIGHRHFFDAFHHARRFPRVGCAIDEEIAQINLLDYLEDVYTIHGGTSSEEDW